MLETMDNIKINNNIKTPDNETLYKLKNNYYEDLSIENKLCSLLVNLLNAGDNFIANVDMLQNNTNKFGEKKPLLDSDYYNFILNNSEKILDIIEKHKNTPSFQLSYFGFETLKNKYLIKSGEYQENIDFLWMRIASFVKRDKWDELEKMYVNLKQGYYIHATPTLFNAGTINHQMASCFLLGTDDNIESIFQSVAECAKISKFAGGIGLHISNIRSNNSYIHGTNGTSNGIIPMLKVYNSTARYIDQGGGKRNGAFAIYLECWHSDIFEFLLLKKNVGLDEVRARDLFYALWVSDIFMECVEKDKDWYLMNPSDCPDLHNSWGKEFEKNYKNHIDNNNFVKKVSARHLWLEICKIQIETGTPYILYKDNCNKLSNQKNLGTISSSNLCCEIIQYSDFKEYAVCNLASIGLSKFLVENKNIEKIDRVFVLGKRNCSFCDLSKHFLKKFNINFEYTDLITDENKHLLKGTSFPNIYIQLKGETEMKFIGGFIDLWTNFLTYEFDYEHLSEITQELVVNLNDIIDKNMYPIEKCKISNMKNRPLGIGIQGLADVFMKLLIPYDSQKAREINMKIFETMYFSAIKKSVELAKIDKKPYDSFKGSDLSKGIFHFELYDDYDEWKKSYSFNYDWESLRKDVLKYGVKNSLFLAPMPTASTSQILNNTESFEPLTSNFYLRRTSDGEFYVMNRNMQEILKAIHKWNHDMQTRLIFDKGSLIQNETIPSFIKQIYRTVWEIPQKHCIEMAADRQRFIDQSQSMNIYLTNPSIDLLTKIHFYGWKKKLKTGSYYIRTRNMNSSQNFAMNIEDEQNMKECENCSS